MTTSANLGRRTRVLGGVTAVVGAAFLVQPGRLTRALTRSDHVPADTLIRVLGGRQLVQGVLQIAYPAEQPVAGGIAVDGLHLLSMLVAAVIWPGYRRAALASAALAAISAGAGAGILRSRS